MKLIHKYYLLLFFLPGLAAAQEKVEPFEVPDYMQKGMILYLPFDEEKPEDNKDLSGTHQEIAKISPDIKTVEGTRGKALHFNGGGGLVIDRSAQFDFERSFTIAFWLKTDSEVEAGDPDEEKPAPIFVGNAGYDVTNRMDIGWAVTPDDKEEDDVHFRLNSRRTYQQSGKLEADAWTHVAVVYHAPFDMFVYVNGQEVTRGKGIPFTPSDRALKIGRSIHGAIDEVCIWTRDLVIGELLDHMKATGGKHGLRAPQSTVLQVGASAAFPHLDRSWHLYQPSLQRVTPPNGHRFVQVDVQIRNAMKEPRVEARLDSLFDETVYTHFGYHHKNGLQPKLEWPLVLTNNQGLAHAVFIVPDTESKAILTLYDDVVTVEWPGTAGESPGNHLVENTQLRVLGAQATESLEVEKGGWKRTQRLREGQIVKVTVGITGTKPSPLIHRQRVDDVEGDFLTVNPNLIQATVDGRPSKLLGMWNEYGLSGNNIRAEAAGGRAEAEITLCYTAPDDASVISLYFCGRKIADQTINKGAE
ncbi:MAG: LamG domain-containing protein [Verrucomicrobiota bacterium]